MPNAQGPARMLLTLVALVVAVEPEVEACIADDAAACRELGRQALRVGDAERRAEALLHFVHACDLGDGASCAEAATLLEGREGNLGAALRWRASTLSEIPASPPPPEREPPVELATVAATEELAEEEPAVGGSRLGIVAYVAGKAGTTGAGVVAGVGVRVGLRERAPEPFMFMPALAIVGGIAWDAGGPQPWCEVRAEVMGARGGGVLQPAFHGFVSVGTAVRAWAPPVVAQPLTGLASPSVVRPYAGLGTGWNWVPRGNGSNGDLGLLAMSIGLPVIFAGRVELRVAPPLNDADSTEVSALFGTGF